MLPLSSSLRRLALAHFCLECQFWFPVWMLFLSHRGFELTTMVLADGVFRFTMVALEFPMGLFGDRVGRKRAYVLVAALAALTYTGITLIQGRLLLFVVWILWGVFWALASGTTSAYCYELIAAEGREEEAVGVLGFMRAVASTAALISHLAAGFLFAALPVLPFVANGVLALGALGLALTLPDPPQVAHRGPRSFTRFLSSQRGNPSFFVGIALLAVALIYFWSPRILMQPLYMELGLGPAMVSAVYFAYSLAGVLAGLAAGTVQKLVGKKVAVLAGVGMLWMGVVLVAVVPGVGALVFFPLFSFGYYLAHTLLEVLLHRQMDNRHRASVLSAASFVGGLFIIVTRPGLGILADVEGTPFAFLVWAVVGVGVLVGFVVMMRWVPRDEPVT